jgi:hypothetical protein
LSATSCLSQAQPRLLACHFNELVKLQYSAGPRFEWLPVFTVYGSEPDMLKLPGLNPAGRLCGAKDLYKVIGLTLVDDI